ncbi:hypothetical protein [Paenibacillus harenae]|uniref:Uncharacterized protein n=1 Tax=Paenibacillus harenae TaxID=306543 RepID=A0ABT9TZ94_PAEHA|nr:hypothetical protein [Paenibacillus harenae]MDQ0112702.1 hypothetical protein [Paenibacillus harenae]
MAITANIEHFNQSFATEQQCLSFIYELKWPNSWDCIQQKPDIAAEGHPSAEAENKEHAAIDYPLRRKFPSLKIMSVQISSNLQLIDGM